MTESGLPTSFINRSAFAQTRQQESPIKDSFPIAADGGFGPMNDENSKDKPDDPKENSNSNTVVREMEDFGEDFDDFEAEAVDEDFGDFDEVSQESSYPVNENEPEPQTSASSGQAPFSPKFPFVSSSTGRHECFLYSCTSLPSQPLKVTDHRKFLSHCLILAKLAH